MCRYDSYFRCGGLASWSHTYSNNGCGSMRLAEAMIRRYKEILDATISDESCCQWKKGNPHNLFTNGLSVVNDGQIFLQAKDFCENPSFMYMRTKNVKVRTPQKFPLYSMQICLKQRKLFDIAKTYF